MKWNSILDFFQELKIGRRALFRIDLIPVSFRRDLSLVLGLHVLALVFSLN